MCRDRRFKRVTISRAILASVCALIGVKYRRMVLAYRWQHSASDLFF
jgi:hypothetical protein